MSEIKLKAYAKINLGLDITGRRKDGYHLLKMVMQTISVCDEITIGCTDNAPGSIDITSSDPAAPSDSSNIAYKAAAALIRHCGIEQGVRIHIEKNIPVAAGLAGGSADAAAVIVGMNELFGLKLGEDEMDEIALTLGADVPFCLRKGTFLAEGIGEVLTKLTDCPDFYGVLVAPPVSVSTPWCYKAYDEIADPVHPDMEALLAAINAADAAAIAQNMGNALEQVTIPAHPVIDEIKNILYSCGAKGAMMSGSGAATFGLFADEKAAQACMDIFSADSARFGRIYTFDLVHQ